MHKDKLWNYRGKVKRVIDGDTLEVIIDLGFQLSCVQRVRLLRVDTEELNDKDIAKKEKALSAKRYVEDIIKNHSVENEWYLIVSTSKGDSFGRWLAEVSIDGVNISDKLLEMNLANHYKE